VKEIEIIGRAVDWHKDWQDGGPPARAKDRPLDLLEAAAVSGLRVHQLKRAIRAGMLKAQWRGRYYVGRADVDELMRALRRRKAMTSLSANKGEGLMPHKGDSSCRLKTSTTR
jgi:hypothetical protein